MTHVFAPSRLHFGLLNVTDIPGRRRFGGCGLMLENPGVSVRVEPFSEWQPSGPSSNRAVEFAKQVTDIPHRIVVENCPSEHIGLGVGTSLGLAVAKAIHPDKPTSKLARMIGRGKRSGIGLHGFDHGGFLIDSGKDSDDELPRLIHSLRFPPEWKIVLIHPNHPGEWYGRAEQSAFDRIKGTPRPEPELSRMESLLFREIPGAIESVDFDRFATALGEYNRLAGASFAADQGGTFAGQVVTSLVSAVQELGFPGVGQSSWGPTVFAMTPSADRATELAEAIRHRFRELKSVDITSAVNHGATVSTEPNA